MREKYKLMRRCGEVQFCASVNFKTETRKLLAIICLARHVERGGHGGFRCYLFSSEVALSIVPYGVEDEGFGQ